MTEAQKQLWIFRPCLTFGDGARPGHPVRRPTSFPRHSLAFSTLSKADSDDTACPSRAATCKHQFGCYPHDHGIGLFLSADFIPWADRPIGPPSAALILGLVLPPDCRAGLTGATHATNKGCAGDQQPASWAHRLAAINVHCPSLLFTVEQSSKSKHPRYQTYPRSSLPAHRPERR